MSETALAPKVNITLPDGKVLTFTRGVTGAEIAASIGPGLAKAALIVEVNGKQWDLFRPIEQDAKLRVITRKDPEVLELIRHDAAHVLAMAVQELFPGTQVTIGPAIEDGFYYDFARDTPFTPDDLPKIEAKMREIVAKDLPTKRVVWPRDEAIKHFESIGETFKAELIRSLPADEEISIYYHGDWHDLCRGHVPAMAIADHCRVGRGHRAKRRDRGLRSRFLGVSHYSVQQNDGQDRNGFVRQRGVTLIDPDRRRDRGGGQEQDDEHILKLRKEPTPRGHRVLGRELVWSMALEARPGLLLGQSQLRVGAELADEVFDTPPVRRARVRRVAHGSSHDVT